MGARNSGIGSAMRAIMKEEVERSSFGLDKGRYVSQTKAAPDWAEGAAVLVREVTSPIVDVTYPDNAPIALAYQDGVASFPLNLGRIRDESFSPTVSVHANLKTTPNVIGIGTKQHETGVATYRTVSTAIADLSGRLTGISNALALIPEATVDPASLVAAANGALVNLSLAVGVLQDLVSALSDEGSYSSSVVGSP